MNAGCPLCGTEQYKVIYGHLHYPGASLVKCDHCSHIYTRLKLDTENKNLYSEGAYELVDTRNSIYDKILSWEYGRVIRVINRLMPRKGRLLDFGCGKGKWGSIAKKMGWQVNGIETAVERAAYAKNIYGLDVSTAVYSEGKIFPYDFEVITLFHVIEHLEHPQVLLDELIKNNLSKDGLIVIEVPNINSEQSRLAGNKWMHLDPPRHINHFTPKRLEQMARDLGLTAVRISSFSFHLGVLGIIDSILKRFGYKKNIIYELKNKKSFFLYLAVILLFPFALPFEYISHLMGRGGIMRYYFIQTK